MKIQILKSSKWVTLLILAAMALCPSQQLSAGVIDNFDDGILDGWGQGAAFPPHCDNPQLIPTNDLFKIVTTCSLATDTNDLARTWAGVAYAYRTFDVMDGYTLELRVDLMEASQNDTFAAFSWHGSIDSYLFLKDQDEIVLGKIHGWPVVYTIFFWENIPIKNENVILVLSLTHAGSDVIINTQVLDKDNTNVALFERRVFDTPAVDPSLPNRSVKGLLMEPDTGAPGTGSGRVELGLWNYSAGTPSPNPVWVSFDNLEVFEYPTPSLAIQKTAFTNQVVLTWPATTVSFQMEGAASLEGPWRSVTNLFTNQGGEYRMELTTSDMMRFYQLRRVESD